MGWKCLTCPTTTYTCPFEAILVSWRLVGNNQTTLLENISSIYALNIVMVVKDQKNDIYRRLVDEGIHGPLNESTFWSTIPPSIGIYMSNIQLLDLSNNLLGRKIPQPFATLNQLSILWLLDNNLTGRIHTIAQFQTQGKIAFQLGNPRFCGPSHSKVCKRDSFINVTKTLWHSVIG